MLVCGRVAVDKDEPKIQKYAQNSVASLQDLIGAPYQLSEVIDARIEVGFFPFSCSVKWSPYPLSQSIPSCKSNTNV